MNLRLVFLIEIGWLAIETVCSVIVTELNRSRNLCFSLPMPVSVKQVTMEMAHTVRRKAAVQ